MSIHSRHEAAMERDYEQMQENAALGRHMQSCMEAILHDNDANDVDDLYRIIYKYTPCGPWLSVQLHDGTWRHCDKLQGIHAGEVRRVQVGSIVEGLDAYVEGDVLDLMNFEEPCEAAAAFENQVEMVNEEACHLWDEANSEGEEDEQSDSD